ncbi:hypothetical protein [Paenibacillus sp. H1-7]|uniref:hypothetical protein n=1 Tax=Paenibacillus sp. H1-7 TaxID=2282849 RepID=UPI001EF89ADE|nr:hypothetical protein [Paenibacillus sp. H1-7]
MKYDVQEVSQGGGGCMFPGRWIGGAALVLGPMLLMAGVLLRVKFHFFFPNQLEAVRTHPVLMTVSYSFFSTGTVLMWPAVIMLVGLIQIKQRGWALWGGVFAVCGLFARTFHAGVDHLAFQLVRHQGLEPAVKAVADSYGAFHIFSSLNLAILLGWIVLAIGAYRAGTLNLFGAAALALMSGLPLGVLKGTTLFSIAAAAGACIALVPLGIRVLRDGPMPNRRTALGWIAGVLAAGGAFFAIGQLG